MKNPGRSPEVECERYEAVAFRHIPFTLLRRDTGPDSTGKLVPYPSVFEVGRAALRTGRKPSRRAVDPSKTETGRSPTPNAADIRGEISIQPEALAAGTRVCADPPGWLPRHVEQGGSSSSLLVIIAISFSSRAPGDAEFSFARLICNWFKPEALLMELLGAEESDEGPDDGALSGSGDYDGKLTLIKGTLIRHRYYRGMPNEDEPRTYYGVFTATCRSCSSLTISLAYIPSPSPLALNLFYSQMWYMGFTDPVVFSHWLELRAVRGPMADNYSR
ncbi:hypothetical protein K438DRAFT_1753458 [Mycena galopus ATCC 62051]|nr:hypothetical protein K438DRAFT_1753458 [Mycena galopus ATCC 62051]